MECAITREAALPLHTLLEVVWLDSEGNIASTEESKEFNVAGSSNTTATSLISQLNFNALRISHTGVYTCLTNMTIPDVVTDHQVNKTVSISVTCEYKVS